MIGIDTILKKLKIKEIIAIILISTLAITFLPQNIMDTMKLSEVKTKYQTQISLALVLSCAYYLLITITFLFNAIGGKLNNPKKRAIKYLKNDMSIDEMGLLMNVFYSQNEDRFKSSGGIDINDGRKTALEYHGVIYRAASVSKRFTIFDYNLQPYAREFLNRNLENGNIKIKDNNIEWCLK